MSRIIGTSAYGLRGPIFREGDDLVSEVIKSVKESHIEPKDNDIISITESVVARVQGNYVTLDEVAENVKQVTHNAETVAIVDPIFSRNRFAMILKGIARGVGKKVIIYMPDVDEKGNTRNNHPVTKMNYDEYYTSIVQGENKECEIITDLNDLFNATNSIDAYIVACIHTREKTKLMLEEKLQNAHIYDLTSFCSDKCEYGLYGSNKATEEKLKLFPNGVKAKEFVDTLQNRLETEFGKHFEVAVYGDGCYHDETTGIWEFADPVTCPAYTSKLSESGNEIKIKNFADDKFKNLFGKELEEAVKNEIRNKGDLDGKMDSQGTTPRKFYSLIASLSDLMSASGDKGIYAVYIQGYFDNYADE